MSIREELNKIKNAVFGIEIRQAIHDAIEKAYNDAGEEHDNANMEVKLARGEYPNLDSRLNANDGIVSSNKSEIDQNLVDLSTRVDQNKNDTNQSLVDANARINGLQIESGEDADGSWVKFPDGTMIIYEKFIFGAVEVNNVPANEEDIFVSDWYELANMPQRFITPPIVRVTVSRSTTGYDLAVGSVGDSQITTTSYGRIIFKSATSMVYNDVEVTAMAIGRWK